MTPSLQNEHLERSREELLGAIGEHPDLVFVRGIGNLGDELICAGTRRLLDGHVYREIGIEELSGADGHTVLICGGGAFCHPFHEFMPRVLAIAELRFERVVVLPSSFDASVDVVRDALRRSRALVFAREEESFRQIQPLCDSRLAHDCAFFFDFDRYRSDAGEGSLNAFRTDEEASGEHRPPADSIDISLTEPSLDAWLRRIAAHRLIRTDRAHVMIAGAMLGKRVEFGSSSYFKVPAIAEYALRAFPVKPLMAECSIIDRPRAQLGPTPCSIDAQATRELLRAHAQSTPTPKLQTPPSEGEPRVTAVILSHERAAKALGAIASVLAESERAALAVRIVVLDNNSGEQTKGILSQACAENPSVELHLSDRNLGCAGGRSFALESGSSELVLFLDDDAELMPGALAHLISELDLHPEAQGISATVLLPDRRVSHSGGWYSESRDAVSFTLAHSGLPLEQTELSVSGPCDWIPGTAALVRRELFERFPLDTEMASYYEDTEWCLRVARSRTASFRRSREALVLHHSAQKPWGHGDFRGRASVVEMMTTSAHFYRRHGRLLRVPGVDVFALVPGLVHPDGTLELASARILMELASTHSSDWLLMQWSNGGLDPLLRGVDTGAEALGAQVQALSAELVDARVQLESAGTQLKQARAQVATTSGERDEAQRRLQRIYQSRLWKLGASYDRVRRGTHRIRSLVGGR